VKKKYVFLGDINSINIEIICKAHKKLKNKVQYILFGNIKDLSNYQKKISSNIDINEILDPINFSGFEKKSLNIFNIEKVSADDYKNLLNQITISNYFANYTKIDLVTLPIDKSVFKKKIAFNGMTEYLAKINNSKTKMLMLGEKFSVIPITTHINLKNVNKYVDKIFLNKFIAEILKEIKRKIYGLKFKKIKFLCINPHCSENDTLGFEDKIIKEVISNFKVIKGQFAADSAFNIIENSTLFISMFHDQALIPFKILNKQGINMTLGLNYRRLSPAHGTAKDLKFQNKADITPYLACMHN
jgi:4-hydroxythreonine-4-phosphate dehydrogenase